MHDLSVKTQVQGIDQWVTGSRRTAKTCSQVGTGGGRGEHGERQQQLNTHAATEIMQYYLLDVRGGVDVLETDCKLREQRGA